MKQISDKDYTLNNFSMASDEAHDYDNPNDEEGVDLTMPFRLSFFGPQNIRGQSVNSPTLNRFTC